MAEYLRVFRHAGFFIACFGEQRSRLLEGNSMSMNSATVECNADCDDKQSGTMAQQIAHAVCAFQHETTGHAPQSVTVVLSDETLVITLHGALMPAETALTHPVSRSRGTVTSAAGGQRGSSPASRACSHLAPRRPDAQVNVLPSPACYDRGLSISGSWPKR